MDEVVELFKPDETTTGVKPQAGSATGLHREFFVEIGGIGEHGQQSGGRRGVYSSDGMCIG